VLIHEVYQTIFHYEKNEFQRFGIEQENRRGFE
jgi:hypothetical protein